MHGTRTHAHMLLARGHTCTRASKHARTHARMRARTHACTGARTLATCCVIANFRGSALNTTSYRSVALRNLT